MSKARLAIVLQVTLMIACLPAVTYALAYTNANHGVTGPDGSSGFASDSGTSHAITTRGYIGPYGIAEAANFQAIAEADLRGNTDRVLAVDAGGIAHKTTGPGNEGVVSNTIHAMAGIQDTWNFSRACVGGPCTTSWTFQIATNITGGLDSNSIVAPRATYQVHWGGFAPTAFAGNATQVGSNNISATYIWQGDQTVNETGVWTWTIPSHFNFVSLTPTVELFASAQLLSTHLLENEDAVIRSRVGFSNSAGFSFDFSDDVSFTSASGVQASRPTASVPEPSSLLLVGSGMLGTVAFRRKLRLSAR